MGVYQPVGSSKESSTLNCLAANPITGGGGGMLLWVDSLPVNAHVTSRGLLYLSEHKVVGFHMARESAEQKRLMVLHPVL